MNGILDSVMAGAKSFRPQSVTQYTSLQLAKKLGDPAGVSKYLSLVNRHTLPMVVEAFLNTQASEIVGVDLVTAFEEELASLTREDDNDEL